MLEEQQYKNAYIKMPEPGDPAIGEFRKAGMWWRLRNKPVGEQKVLLSWDQVLQELKEYGVVPQEASGIDDLIAFYNRPVQRVGEVESEANEAEERDISQVAQQIARDSIEKGERPSDTFMAEYGAIAEQVARDMGVDLESLAPAMDDAESDVTAADMDAALDAALDAADEVWGLVAPPPVESQPAAAPRSAPAADQLFTVPESRRQRNPGETDRPQVPQDQLLGPLRESVKAGDLERRQGKMDFGDDAADTRAQAATDDPLYEQSGEIADAIRRKYEPVTAGTEGTAEDRSGSGGRSDVTRLIEAERNLRGA
jgi:hypothetical protein